ncbi:DinB family protein [Nocardioides marmoriginsengisoli]|uniref:DinB family protein n=1 Tax=Nocardioides marmoriginsengisoli TaxID=661483 RepID=A0A3N0CHY8_9ACTN|nr:DinB family protein [Nocardioides marmoriginsengisoli]RNL62573.1 DinB family protein [Nocardioides marmoriginsengisoli]
MTDLKAELHEKLRSTRAVLLDKLAGLSEYDARRPMTASGTNLLGLVKHMTGNEHVYLGEAFGRTPPDVLPWVADGSIWDGADMWATAEESREHLIALYERACAHGDATLAALDLDAVGSVPHWPEERRATTLGVLLIRMVSETAQHAGHADLCRELIDGSGQADRAEIGDAAYWDDYVATIQAAAERFRS